MAKLELSPIDAISPTLAEIMRSCLLRAGLSRAAGSLAFVLGSPKAWLGNPYHEVLEHIADTDISKKTLDNAVERLWNQAISTQFHRARDRPNDGRFGPPERWPGYYLAHASVLMRARDLLPSISVTTLQPSGHEHSRATAVREKQFSACGGKLVGRPDVIRASEIVDYKSGSLFEQAGEEPTDAIKAAYVRQLQIYGYLVKECLGCRPTRGILLPLAGPGVEFPLKANECQEAALEAVALLDSYNEKIKARVEPLDLATPSPSTCKWCPYKLICPAFWASADASWSGQLDGASIQGTLSEPPHVIHGGAATAVTLNVESGSEVLRVATITPLDQAVYSGINNVHSGDRVRITGLRTRPDGVLTPTQRTIAARTADIPEI